MSNSLPQAIGDVVEPCPHDGENPAQIEAQFCQFFRNALGDSTLTTKNVASMLNMGERNLQRILSGRYRLTAATLVDLARILDIDLSRVWAAIAHFGDWKYYYDPTIIIAIDLIGSVVSNIRRDLPYPLEPLHPKATIQLSKWIAETIIEHQRQLCARREEFSVQRQL